jgi:hypothetical protein
VSRSGREDRRHNALRSRIVRACDVALPALLLVWQAHGSDGARSGDHRCGRRHGGTGSCVHARQTQARLTHTREGVAPSGTLPHARTGPSLPQTPREHEAVRPISCRRFDTLIETIWEPARLAPFSVENAASRATGGSI